MAGFRLQAKNIFLTYPQCPLSKTTLLQHLQVLLCDKVSFIKISQEHHEDQQLHLHALILCHTKLHIRDASFFDLLNYHPNVQAARDVQASLRYLDKEDPEPLCDGDAPQIKRKWSEALEATSKEEYMKTVAEISPRDFQINHERIEYFANKKFKTEVQPYVPKVFTSIPPLVQQWLDQMHTERPKSLILWGPSRLGKTALARSLGQHMYFMGLFNLDKWDDNAKYVIFDDWEDWGKLFQWKCWIGAQEEFDVTDKYRKKKTVKWGKPAIILSNNEPIFPDMAWLKANTMTLQIKGKLF